MKLWPLFWSVLVGVIAWIANEWRRRSIDDFKRKEERYTRLLTGLNGFYEKAEEIYGKEKTDELKQDFMDQVKLCWLYCPDEVVRKANNFLTKVEKGEEGREQAAGELFVAIRKDLFSIKYIASDVRWRWRANPLTAEEFKHVVLAKEQQEDKEKVP